MLSKYREKGATAPKWDQQRSFDSESSEGEIDPDISLTDFRKTTKKVMLEAGIHRRPSVQVKGPGQADAMFSVF